jgi:periplasmic protein TonB
VQQSPRYRRSRSGAFQVPARRRAAGVLVALVLEGLLVLALLTLGSKADRPRPEEPRAIAFDLAENSPVPPAPETQPEKRTRSAPQTDTTEPPRDQASEVPIENPAPRSEVSEAPLVELSRDELAAADLRSLPPARSTPSSPGRSKSGPPAPANSGDTPVVAGSGPNGERLYAAAWYREPYDSELRGYLSTAQGPGWGLIACRTIDDFRVDSCVAVDEYPQGSRITRAALAAAWQFRVRPPQIGGKLRIGEWVRIRIDYIAR